MSTVEADVRIDHKIGDFFLPHLKNATKRLWIMSPWVHADYMDAALGKKESGLDVKIFTSNDYVPGQREAIRKLIESQKRVIRPQRARLKYSGLGMILGGLALAPFTKGLSLFVSLVGIILFAFGREKSEIYWISNLGAGNLRVFAVSPYKSIHAKVYIADDMVIMGSANLTKNGTKANMESMVVLKSESLASEMMKVMSETPQALGFKDVSYDQLGLDTSIQRSKNSRLRF